MLRSRVLYGVCDIVIVKYIWCSVSVILHFALFFLINVTLFFAFCDDSDRIVQVSLHGARLPLCSCSC